ncbi:MULTISPECIES: hypothetical protein [unclassified Streptomyces]|nr:MULTISPECIES: hypothetical protein [unclassified Streptomyces]
MARVERDWLTYSETGHVTAGAGVGRGAKTLWGERSRPPLLPD